jgi:thioredoxin reductase (NADPH)
VSPESSDTHKPIFDSETDPAFPTLSQELLDELAGFGEARTLEPGVVLYHAGALPEEFFVLLEGHIEVAREDDSNDVIVAYHDGQFVGEMSLLTGQHSFLAARTTARSRILVIPQAAFRKLMATKPAVADVVFGALLARREALRSSAATASIRIVGSRYSPEALALRTFAARNRLPYSWIDLEDADDVHALLSTAGLTAGDTPVVFTATAVLRRPTPGELAETLGLTYHSVPGRTFDLVVVGAGPAGLAASVNGAAEGLDTVAIDAVGPGGQAGSSSRIENYPGFPTGISGGDLTAAVSAQAMRLGSELFNPCTVSGLRSEHGLHVLELTDGSEIPTRSVIVATGAQYQRLDISNLREFEGNGVYYAATDLEVRTCGGAHVVVVGGGNSAGQAALYLSRSGGHVSLVVRRPGLHETMSSYLVDRIDVDPNIDVLVETEVCGLEGAGHLKQVALRHNPTGTATTRDAAALFCFIGARPATGWLNGAVALDDKGFILTDRSVPSDAGLDPGFASREPLLFETSVPGIFAVGDVRSGSLKRVASAVGEGSSSVASAYQYVRALSERPVVVTA